MRLTGGGGKSFHDTPIMATAMATATVTAGAHFAAIRALGAELVAGRQRFTDDTLARLIGDDDNDEYEDDFEDDDGDDYADEEFESDDGDADADADNDTGAQLPQTPRRSRRPPRLIRSTTAPSVFGRRSFGFDKAIMFCRNTKEEDHS